MTPQPISAPPRGGALFLGSFDALLRRRRHEFCTEKRVNRRAEPGGAMVECILNYCSGHAAADYLVILYYFSAVAVAYGLSYLANSRAIRTAASLIGIAWAFGLFAYLYLAGPGYYLVAVMLDTVLMFQFWRMGRVSIFPVPLFYLQLIEIAFIVLAQSAGLSNFATMLVLNRVFEVVLLYLIGCSLFRLYVASLQKKSKEPITDWRVRFVVG